MKNAGCSLKPPEPGKDSFEHEGGWASAQSEKSRSEASMAILETVGFLEMLRRQIQGTSDSMTPHLNGY